jgi:hypothetical protein
MTHSIRRPDRRNRKLRHLALETLEGRTLLSLGAEFPATVNTTIRNAQFNSANASSANGSSVAVWVDTFSPTDHDIRAQRFDAAGNKAGPEILVSGNPLDEAQPAVAMDSLGDFVVAWRQTLSSGDTNVLARRFNSAGQSVGAVVPVGVGTFKERDPSVAMDGPGNFVVAYTRVTNNNNPDVFAKRYNTANQLTTVVNVDTDPNIAEVPSIAMTPDGRFDVAYEYAFSPGSHDIILKQFSASGALSWTREVANSQPDETAPSVSIDNAGNAVVAWQVPSSGGSSQVRFSRASASGNLGPELIVENSSFFQTGPRVALKRTGGAFVVTYDQNILGNNHVRVAEVSASNQVKIFDASLRSKPAVSINGANHYLVTYTSNDGGDLNIRRRIGTLS